MMNMLVATPARPAEHCSSVFNLRVRSNPAGGEEPQASASGRLPPLSRRRITLYVGEVGASKTPVVMNTLLGSCVAVCLYDPVLGAGGMNHILLPTCQAGDKSPRCGIHAMELLINELMKLGGDRRKFIAKAFGGANVLPGIRMPSVGDGNASFVREFLVTERIPLVAERMGGNHAVHLYFWTDSGKATVHTVDGSSLPKIINAERAYWKPPATPRPFYGEITLF